MIRIANSNNIKRFGGRLFADSNLPGVTEALVINRCSNHALSRKDVMEKMEEINRHIRLHGVEVIRHKSDKAKDIIYCNSGDTYRTTILYYNGKFRIGDWGSIVERSNGYE